MKLLESYGAWRCFVAQETLYNLPSIETLLQEIDLLPETLADNRRNLVKKGEFVGRQVIAKKSRDKHRRKWARFVSIFRVAEAKQTFASLLEFSALGIPSVQPICVLEKRLGRQVVDSWLIYEYREGQRCSPEALEDIVALLNKLHHHGFCHEDPTLGNFLIDPQGVMFLIDCKGKKKLSDIAVYYDFMLLGLKNKGISLAQVEALIDVNRFSLGYYLSRLYVAYIGARGRLKKRLGRSRSRDDFTN